MQHERRVIEMEHTSVFDCDRQPQGSQPDNTRASRGEPAEEWLPKAKNTLRLLDNTAEHETGMSKAITQKNADELYQDIRKAEDAELEGLVRQREGAVGITLKRLNHRIEGLYNGMEYRRRR